MIGRAALLIAVAAAFHGPPTLAQPAPGWRQPAAVPATAGLYLPPNPVIARRIAEVSPDRLRADLTALVGFYTRHTNSSTTARTRGIGAARDGLHAQLAGIGGISGGRLAADFFDFDASTCDVSRRHRNVIATLPGEQAPHRHFIAMAHMDSRTRDRCDDSGHAPGADDNGSGTVALLELARGLAGMDLEATVILSAVTGEEQGLLGSTAYAREAQRTGRRIDGVLNSDIIGSPTGCENPACPPGEPRLTDAGSVRLFSDGPATGAHRQLARAVKLQAERYQPELAIGLIAARDRPGRGGDHTAFAARGYAAVRFTESLEDGDGSGRNGHQHNENDTLDQVDFEYLARVTRANLAVLANLALAPETPDDPSVEALPSGELRLTWPSLTTAPDPAGYRVAIRRTPEDSLFYHDIRDAGRTAGATQAAIIAGLPPGEPVYLSVSAYDADGNESIFSTEARAVPLPAAPTTVLTATTTPTATAAATGATPAPSMTVPPTPPATATPRPGRTWLPYAERR
jgi:hypothetical protein